MKSDEQLARIEVVHPLRVARAYSLLNCAREEAALWARQKEQRENKERIVWEFWRAGFERNYHSEPGIVELGEID